MHEDKILLVLQELRKIREELKEIKKDLKKEEKTTRSESCEFNKLLGCWVGLECWLPRNSSEGWEYLEKTIIFLSEFLSQIIVKIFEYILIIYM